MSIFEVKEVGLHLLIVHSPNGMQEISVIVPYGGRHHRVSGSSWLCQGSILLALLLMQPTQELIVWGFIFLLLAFLDPVAATSAIETLHHLYVGLPRPWPEYVDLSIIYFLWILCFYFVTEVLLGIELLGGFSCHTTWKEGICFECFGDFSYFH